MAPVPGVATGFVVPLLAGSGGAKAAWSARTESSSRSFAHGAPRSLLSLASPTALSPQMEPSCPWWPENLRPAVTYLRSPACVQGWGPRTLAGSLCCPVRRGLVCWEPSSRYLELAGIPGQVSSGLLGFEHFSVCGDGRAAVAYQYRYRRWLPWHRAPRHGRPRPSGSGHSTYDQLQALRPRGPCLELLVLLASEDPVELSWRAPSVVAHITVFSGPGRRAIAGLAGPMAQGHCPARKDKSPHLGALGVLAAGGNQPDFAASCSWVPPVPQRWLPARRPCRPSPGPGWLWSPRAPWWGWCHRRRARRLVLVWG